MVFNVIIKFLRSVFIIAVISIFTDFNIESFGQIADIASFLSFHLDKAFFIRSVHKCLTHSLKWKVC